MARDASTMMAREPSQGLRRHSINLATAGAAYVPHEGVESAEPAEGYSAAAQAARQAESKIKMLKGVHPYRILLSDVVKRLRNTKTRMQALMSGVKPDDHAPWYASLHISRCSAAAHIVVLMRTRMQHVGGMHA